MFLSDINIANGPPKHYLKIVRKACLADGIIFIHIPKNAGTSMKKTLGLSRSPCHLFASEIKHAVGKKYFESKSRICVIRNPWDRLVSIYYQQCAKKRRGRTRLFPDIKGSGGLVPGFENGIPTFEDFITNHFPKTWWQERSLSQTRYIQHGSEDKVIVDNILKYEQLDEGWMNLSGELGANFGPLSRLNKSDIKKDGYREFYKAGKSGFNHKLIDKASELVEVDAKNFGYKF